MITGRTMRCRLSAPRCLSLTADVGANMMKTWLTLLALVLCIGCVSHPSTTSNNTTRQWSYGTDLRFWQVMTTNTVRTQFDGNPNASRELIDVIIKKATTDFPPVFVTIYLCHGVAVSNSYWLQEMAEKRGVTNITVKLNQSAPQLTRSENGKLQQGGPGYPPQGVGSPDP